jgi:hypothetical protein
MVLDFIRFPLSIDFNLRLGAETSHPENRRGGLASCRHLSVRGGMVFCEENLFFKSAMR